MYLTYALYLPFPVGKNAPPGRNIQYHHVSSNVFQSMCTKSPSKSYKSKRVNLATSCCNASHLFTIFLWEPSHMGAIRKCKNVTYFFEGVCWPWLWWGRRQLGGEECVSTFWQQQFSPFKPPTDAPFEKVEKFDSVVVDHCGRRHYCSAKGHP